MRLNTIERPNSNEAAPTAGSGNIPDVRAALLVGFAGLAALALLLGISPWSLWPFVASITLALGTVMAIQGRSVTVATVIGVVAGLLWALGTWWRSGIPSFTEWFVPIASYIILVLAIHHAIVLRAAAAHAGGFRSGLGHAGSPEGTSPRIEPAARTAQGLLHAFGQWHGDWADQDEPWSAFDCFLRDQLLDRVQAKHVVCFRVVADGRQLMPLAGSDNPALNDGLVLRRTLATRASDRPDADRGGPRGSNRLRPAWKPLPIGPRSGIEGHVATTGQMYIEGRNDQSHALESSAEQASTPVVWCFPIRRGDETIGVVRVGTLPQKILRDPLLLELVAELVSLCWARVCDVHELGIARRMDTVSGLLARSDFLTVATHALADSLESKEPVVLVVLAIEGMRALDDQAQWGARDELAHRAGNALNQRLRSDDVVGRFSDDRFVVLLRRTDRAIGRLLAEELRDRMLTALCAKTDDNASAADQGPGVLGVRCAAVGGQWPVPDAGVSIAQAQVLLHESIAHALARLDAARLRGQNVISDDDDDDVPITPPADPGTDVGTPDYTLAH